jgi:fibronectin type 3 domain-containing protein
VNLLNITRGIAAAILLVFLMWGPSARAQTQHWIALTWTAPTGTAPASYNIYRSLTTGGPYTKIGSCLTTNVTDNTPVAGTKYFYVVTAVNASGVESIDSNEASATEISNPATPATPVATAGNAQVALTWTAVTGAVTYNVKRATTTGGPYTTVGSPTANSYTDTGLTNGTTYFYVVSAVNANGESANSAQVSAVPAAPVVSPPTGLTAVPH